MAKSKKEKLEVVEQQEEQSTFYYFYSQGCGFCKRSEPIVDEINKEGKYEILKLDLAESDNQGLKKELEQKYKKNCGTPWFINADTGHQVCGFREKDIIEKWLAGEDIPAPPRPKGPMPKPPFHDASKADVDKWKKEYGGWAEENSHLPNIQTAEQILERPRPKSDPPRPPVPNSTDEIIDAWGEDYKKWADENKHLPNMMPVDQMIQRFKQRRDGQQQPQPGMPTPQAPNVQAPPQGGNVKLTFDQRLSSLENKIDKIINALGA